jgi:hypothetical protein
MTELRKELCRDCGEPDYPRRMVPRRYDDGRHRCRDCQQRRRESIVAYWQNAGIAYSQTPGRGGYANGGTWASKLD